MRMTRNLIFDVSACCVNEKNNFFFAKKTKAKKHSFSSFFLSFFFFSNRSFLRILPQTIKHSFLSLKRSFRAIRGGRARDDDDTD